MSEETIAPAVLTPIDAPATGVPLTGVELPADGSVHEVTLEAAPVAPVEAATPATPVMGTGGAEPAQEAPSAPETPAAPSPEPELPLAPVPDPTPQAAPVAAPAVVATVVSAAEALAHPEVQKVIASLTEDADALRGRVQAAEDKAANLAEQVAQFAGHHPISHFMQALESAITGELAKLGL